VFYDFMQLHLVGRRVLCFIHETEKSNLFHQLLIYVFKIKYSDVCLDCLMAHTFQLQKLIKTS
jgi:hypothetical protein